jgi:hypothetical protein
VLVVQPKEDIVNEPQIGDVRVSEVGDTLVRTAKVTRLPALNLETEFEFKAFGLHAWFPPGLYVAKNESNEWTCYRAPKGVRFKTLGTGEREGGICESKIHPGSYAIYLWDEGTAPTIIEGAPPTVGAAEFVGSSAPEYSQELIYNGRSGNDVRFLYREFSAGMARPAFDQAVQYDLAEGATIGFKGCRIEILDATNTTIRFRVLAHFPGVLGSR